MIRFSQTLVLLFFMTTALAQERHVKIITEKNGERTVIEKELEEGESFDLDEFLEQEGIEIEIEELGDGNQTIEVIISDDEDRYSDEHQYSFDLQTSCKPKAFLGVVPKEDSGDAGVTIHEVIGESSAEDMGLQEGDVIKEFEGEGINEFSDLVDAIAKVEPGAEVKMTIIREGKKKKIDGTIGERQPERFFFHHPNMDDDQTFHFEFDGERFDEMMESLEERMEGLHEMEFEFKGEEMEEWLEKFEHQMEDWTENLEMDVDRLIKERTVVIIIEEIEPEELEQVNQQASPELRLADDLELDELRFFPNPGNGRFNLSFQTDSAGDLEVMVFNQEGKTVYYEMLGDFEGRYDNRIDISNRASGKYFLQIKQNAKTYSRKLIKQ